MTIRDASVAFAGKTVRNNAFEPPILLLLLPSDRSALLLPAASSGKEKVRLNRFDTCNPYAAQGGRINCGEGHRGLLARGTRVAQVHSVLSDIENDFQRPGHNILQKQQLWRRRYSTLLSPSSNNLMVSR